MPMNNMSQTALRCPEKTLWVWVTGLLGLDNPHYAHQSCQCGSNPLLQSFEGAFEGIVEEVSINHTRLDRTVTQRLLHGKDIQTAVVKVAGEGMSKRMGVNVFRYPSLCHPFTQTALHLPGGYPFQALAQEKSWTVEGHLLTFFQVAMQDRPQLRVEKAIDGLSTLGFDGDLLLQQIDIGDIQIDKLRQTDAGVKKELDDHPVALSFPALVGSDGLQQDAHFVGSQVGRRFAVVAPDVNGTCGIVLDVPRFLQPAEEGLDSRTSAVDRCCGFRSAIRLMHHRPIEEEAVKVDRSDTCDFAVCLKAVQQEPQIALLGTNGMWRSAVGKLVIHELLHCLFNIQIILLFLFVKSYVQQCSQNRMQVKVKNEINVTVRW